MSASSSFIVPPLVSALAESIRAQGGRLLVTGGAVRDHLRGEASPKDVDCEVFGLASDQLLNLLSSFGPVNTVGASFGVYKLHDMDISIPRYDSKHGIGHKAFEVVGDPH